MKALIAEVWQEIVAGPCREIGGYAHEDRLIMASLIGSALLFVVLLCLPFVWR